MSKAKVTPKKQEDTKKNKVKKLSSSDLKKSKGGMAVSGRKQSMPYGLTGES